MAIKPVFLATDIMVYLLILLVCGFFWWQRNNIQFREAWLRVLQNPLGMLSLVILTIYILIAVLDCLHFQKALPTTAGQPTQYSTKVYSAFDALVSPLGQNDEKTYSAPFATHLYNIETIPYETVLGSVPLRTYPALMHAGLELKKFSKNKTTDILSRIAWSAVVTLIIGLMLIALLPFLFSDKLNHSQKLTNLFHGNTRIAWRSGLLTFGLALFIIIALFNLAAEYHVLGTNKIGQDVLYHSLKSIRTGLIIGTLTTLFMLPFALFLGTVAGYYGHFIDDVIQYIYTTLSSIPGVLLIAASVLSLQIFIANHEDLFATVAERADMRLLILCMILGITSWTSLCRLLRAETLKIRELDYITAARSLGVNNGNIILRHIIPNVMHIVLISVVLDFSGLVLAEAVLSYVGVGVDPTTISWGNMINNARLELAREPVVWWPLLAAFIFMFILVFAANLFADAVRDAFDPRIRKR